MKTRAVIHLDLEDEGRFSTALGNLKNFLEQVPSEEADLRVVANSGAVRFFIKGQAADHEKDVHELSGAGIRFLICNNTISKKGIKRSELLPVCEIVPAGIVEVISLQNQGFAYVKP